MKSEPKFKLFQCFYRF